MLDRIPTLRLANGRAIEMGLDEIKAHAAAETSIMPQGLEQALSVEEMRDLLAYLEGLR
jgi:cytochrome c553